MTDLIDIAQQLWDTEAELVRLRRTIGDHPDQPALEVHLLSLQKRERQLREKFDTLADTKHLDICDYRIIPEESSEYPISAVGSSLQAFQELFTVVFDALINGPKDRGRVSADITQKSTFGLGYVFQGSLGISLTIPSERLLLIESNATRAAELVLALLKSEDTKEIRALVSDLGVAAATKAHSLSNVHASYGFNSRIRWRRGREVVHDAVVNTSQYERLRDLIDESGDDTEEGATLQGRLVGLDVDTDYFHFKFPDAADVKGVLSEEFRHDEAHDVPGMYQADVIKRVSVRYSTGREDETWELLALRKL